MITIKSMRSDLPSKPYDVVVDRSSFLGNPFVISATQGRDEVCKKYDSYFKDTLLHGYNTPALKELRRMQDIYHRYGKLRLFCWCSPKQCHAETIKRYILSHEETS